MTRAAEHREDGGTRRDLAWARFWLAFFAAALVVSGLTAIFVRDELRLLSPLFDGGSASHHLWPSLADWLASVRRGVEASYDEYPFLAYGYDWLAFGHFVAAVPFLMAIREPRRHVWVVTFGMIACVAVVPFALIMGEVRGIPLYWRGIDALFGILGVGVLLELRRRLKRLGCPQAEAGRQTPGGPL
jgi:hypothetical protein